MLSIAAAAFAETLQTRLRASPSQGGTPRDTGFASAAWFISQYNPSRIVLVTPRNRSERIAAVPALRRISDDTRRNLASYDARRGGLFLTNGASNIVPLNNGSSRQAPRNFVQAAIARTATDPVVGRKIAQAGGRDIRP